jgi:hypothetical protein
MGVTNNKSKRVREGVGEGEKGGGEEVATTTYSERRDVEGLERESGGTRSKHQPQYRSYASEQKQ